MQVYRDFLSEEDREQVEDILDQPGWAFGFISNDDRKPIWNFDPARAQPAIDILIKYLEGFLLDDFHVNGQTLGQTAALHRDSQGGVTHSLVYFPFHWKYTWGGRLHILEKNQFQCITPEKNMAVLFDADCPHYAEAPTENILRTSIGLKLRQK